MRIGIDYRILGVGRELMHRGIGRYTQQQVRAVLEVDQENEFVLLCNSDHDRSLIDPVIRSAPNVSVEVYLADGPDAPPLYETATMLREAEKYFAWMADRKLDLFHATAPFHYDRPVLVDFDVCPMVSSFYDLIPLIYPAQYLSGWWEEQYLRSLSFLGKSTRMIAISRSARTDAATYMGFPSGCIDVAWPVADDCFRVLDAPDLADSLAVLRRRLPLPERFVLTVSHLHHTKNLGTLLRAYSLIPAGVRADLPLVVCCHLDEHSLDHLQGKADQLGVAGDLILTDLVTDEELTALYNAATAVVHPSRYEGFGLPVVEAMSCGAPVVTTTASSLPEAGGDAALLVDPDDAHGFARAIQELYEDPGRRRSMSERGLVHAARFDKDQLARSTLGCYLAALARPEVPAPRRSRLAVFAPLSPDRSAVADHSVVLLDRLADGYDVEVFVDDGCMPDAGFLGRYRVAHSSAVDRRHAQDPFDTFLYEVSGPTLAPSTRTALRAHPGVAVLHDGLAGDDVDEIATGSQAVIVHGEDAAKDLRGRPGGAPVFAMPVGVTDPRRGHRPARRRALRTRLGATDTTFVVGIFATAAGPEGLDECVKALAIAAECHADVLLVIVGPALDDHRLSGLLSLAGSLGIGTRVRLIGEASCTDLGGYLMAVDSMLVPESPTTTAVATIMMRGLAAGCSMIVLERPRWPGLPDDALCVVDDTESDPSRAIAAQFIHLAGDGALRANMSAQARLFYESHGTTDAMAARYADVLDMFCASVRRAVDQAADPARNDTPVVKPFRFNKVCEVEDFSRPELLEIIRDVCTYKLPNLPTGFPIGSEHRKDWEVAMAVRTLRHFGALHRDATILGVAAGAEDTSFFLTREAKQVFATDRYLASGDWEPTAPLSMLIQPQDMAPYPFDADRLVVQHMDGRSLRYPDDTFDGIYSSGSIEHFGDLDDVASAAYEMGRVLKPGGVLTLSTEIRLAGPPGGIGWPGLTLLFSAENLQRFIVDASGLELVDQLDTDVSEETLSVRRDLTQSILQHLAATKEGGQREYEAWEFPHVILLHEGYVFTSVHLALRKPVDYPRVPNAWARPSEVTIASIAEHNRDLIGKTVATAAASPAAGEAPPAPAGAVADHDLLAATALHVTTISDDGAEIDRRTADLDRLIVEVDRHVAEMGVYPGATREGHDLAAHLEAELIAWAGQLDETPSVPSPDDDQARHWRTSRVAIPGGPEFDVVVDPRVGDQVTFALSVGVSLDQTLVKLMTDLVRPGDRILDIGAHVGTFSLAAAAVGALSLAIEASPENAALLRASAARNGFTNITVVEAVASDSPGLIRFHAHGPWGQVALVDDETAVTTAAVSLADLLLTLSWSPLAFVKMDVEGWELQVLKGMTDVLADASAPPLLYECNGHTLWPFGATPEDLVRAVAELGYTSYMVDDGRLVEVGTDDFQPQTLIDYLAVKRVPALTGWPVRPPLGLEDRVARIVADGTHANFNHRVYMARALQRAGAAILGHPSVRGLVDDMGRDPVPEVREAIGAWSSVTA